MSSRSPPSCEHQQESPAASSVQNKSSEPLSSSSAAVISEPGFVCPKLGFVAYKHVALLLLVVQTVGAILVMRVSRTVVVSEKPYLNTTAVFIAEVIKFVGSFLLVLWENNWGLGITLARVKSEIICRPDDTLKVGVPALLYTLQNNLLFIALSNMSGALYQVTYQLKILTTALLSVIILRRWLSLDKWLSLLILFLGVALIQIPTGKSSSSATTVEGSLFVGTSAVLMACLTSGFAGVYFEKILKGSKTSIWMRNMQLGVLGALLGLIGAYWNDGAAIQADGFLQGYNWATWLAILMQSAGGLIVAAVLKFADNILKCFGNAVAIIMSCLISYYLLGDYDPSIFFVIGTMCVVFATYAYGTEVKLAHAIMHPNSTLKQVLAARNIELEPMVASASKAIEV